MKTAIAGFTLLALASINIFFTFIPEPPLTIMLLINAFFAMFAVMFVVWGLLGRAAPASPNVVEERNKLLLDLDAANIRLKELEALPTTDPTSVLSFLSVLQQKGRFVDFVMDDVTRYDDSQVGAAARIVHQGCSQVIHDYFDLAPVQEAEEGTTVTVEPGEGQSRFRLVGTVSGTPPYRGTLLHRGWRTQRVQLPKTTATPPNQEMGSIIAPAEIELN